MNRDGMDALGVLALALFGLLLFWLSAKAWGQAPLFPTWLWNAPAQWAFSPDQLKLDHQMNGYRVWCWQSYRNPSNYFGVYARGSVTVADLGFSDLRPLNAASCAALIKAYGSP